MTSRSSARVGLAVILAAMMAAGLVLALRPGSFVHKTRLTAYFENSNGIYPGDQVRILGVPVGKVETIEPQPLRAKITFWVEDRHKIPADASAVILSPSLVTARAVELTPAYTDGPSMPDDAVIPQERTAVPVEWDDLRTQFNKLSQTLKPTEPGGVSSAGAFITSVADNLRGQGSDIRTGVIQLSQALSILGDGSGDLFGTVKNLATLVSALHGSSELLRELNQNFGAVTATLANDPGEVGRAVTDLNLAVDDVRDIVAENRETLGTTSDKLEEISSALVESLGDLKQALHVFPTTVSNYVNIYQPAQGAASAALSGTNFSNPINFICGAVQAASRLGAEESAKLCAQYLAPIIKNRAYNFLGPIGVVSAVGASARPNELTYSEDWLRPDYVPPAESVPPVAADSPMPAEAPATANSVTGAVPTDPNAGLPGLMLPGGGGS